METIMYDKLLQLPIFQGLSRNDLTHIIEKVKIHFSKHHAGEKLFKQGDPCDRLSFLVNGSITLSKRDDRDKFVWEEEISDLYFIEPYSLFGISPHYIASYTALTDIQMITIDKSYILSELSNFEIFRLNYYNILSNRTQFLYKKLRDFKIEDIQNFIIEFFIFYAEKMDGKKTLRIKMEDFAELLDDTRLNVSKALNELQEKELLILRRKEIEIHDLAKLVDMYPGRA